MPPTMASEKCMSCRRSSRSDPPRKGKEVRGFPAECHRCLGQNSCGRTVRTHGSRWPSGCSAQQGDNTMLWTIAVILAVLWLLGMVSSYTLGGFIHILLFLAVVALIIQ